MIGNSLCMHACLGENINWRLQSSLEHGLFGAMPHHAYIRVFPGFQLPAVHFSSSYARHLTNCHIDEVAEVAFLELHSLW